MNSSTLAGRVETLEHKVNSLEALPDRVDGLSGRVDALTDRAAAVELQIVQFREDLRVESSAVRTEMRALEDRLRTAITAGLTGTNTQMRVLHEDLVSRIALLGEGGRGRMRKRPSKKH